MLLLDPVLRQLAYYSIWHGATTHPPSQPLPLVFRLPPELVCSIFRHLGLKQRIKTSLVCSHWRQIALSDPVMWSMLDFGDLAHRPSSTWSCFDTLMSRSDPLPLDILRFTVSKESALATGLALRTIFHRVRVLEILWWDKGVWNALQTDVLLRTTAPLLTTFRALDMDDNGASQFVDASIFQGDAPHLTYVELSGVLPPAGVCPAFARVTHLGYSRPWDCDSHPPRPLDVFPRLHSITYTCGSRSMFVVPRIPAHVRRVVLRDPGPWMQINHRDLVLPDGHENIRELIFDTPCAHYSVGAWLHTIPGQFACTIGTPKPTLPREDEQFGMSIHLAHDDGRKRRFWLRAERPHTLHENAAGVVSDVAHKCRVLYAPMEVIFRTRAFAGLQRLVLDVSTSTPVGSHLAEALTVSAAPSLRSLTLRGPRDGSVSFAPRVLCAVIESRTSQRSHTLAELVLNGVKFQLAENQDVADLCVLVTLLLRIVQQGPADESPIVWTR